MEKQLIIETAFDCWQYTMFSTTSLTPLAQALGVTKAAIYRHFPCKEALITEMGDLFARKYRALLDALKSELETGDLEAGIRLWTDGLLAFFRRHPGYLRFYISRIIHRPGEEDRALLETLRRESTLLRQLFCRHGYREEESREIVKYLYTHLTGWALFLEKDADGTIDPILDSFYRGFMETPADIDYAAVEEELSISRPEVEVQGHRILDALLKVVAREGLAGATVSHIAQEAGYSKSSLYSFFKNKNDMLRSILMQHSEAFNSLYHSHIHAEQTMSDQVYRLILLQYRYLEQNRAFLVALNWLRFRNLSLSREEKLNWQASMPDFIDLLSNQECRSFGLENRERFGLLWFQLIREISELCIPEYRSDNRDLADKYHLRYLHKLYCRGLNGFQERRIA